MQGCTLRVYITSVTCIPAALSRAVHALVTVPGDVRREAHKGILIYIH